jgi:hypothetical protein
MPKKTVVEVSCRVSAASGMTVGPLRGKISLPEADIDDPIAMKRFNNAVDAQHKANMRAKRERPEILEAIIAVRGHNNPDPHPYTIAARILERVNAWLKERDYKPVLVDALAKKIPRT